MTGEALKIRRSKTPRSERRPSLPRADFPAAKFMHALRTNRIVATTQLPISHVTRCLSARKNANGGREWILCSPFPSPVSRCTAPTEATLNPLPRPADFLPPDGGGGACFPAAVSATRRAAFTHLRDPIPFPSFPPFLFFARSSSREARGAMSLRSTLSSPCSLPLSHIET